MLQTVSAIQNFAPGDIVGRANFVPLPVDTFLQLNVTASCHLGIFVGTMEDRRLAGMHLPTQNSVKYTLEMPAKADVVVLKNMQETCIERSQVADLFVERTADDPDVIMEPSEKDLVLIHCYGKVGSITLEKALSKFLHKIELVRTHFMVPYQTDGASMTNNRYSRQKFFKPRNGKKFIMTGIRDFYDCSLSSFFQNHGEFLVTVDADPIAVFEQWKTFAQVWSKGYEQWWSKEFFDFYEIDPQRFFKTLDDFSGYCEFDHKDNVHIVYRMDKINHATRQIAEKIGASYSDPSPKNTANEKTYFYLYEQVKAKLKEEPFRFELPYFISKLQAFV